MRFILWDPKDGEPPRDGAGRINTAGVIGRVGIENVYIATYSGVARQRILGLAVGEHIADVEFRLSGERGRYAIYRVE